MAEIKKLLSDNYYRELLEYLKTIPDLTRNIGIILFRSGWLIDFRTPTESLVEMVINDELEKLNSTLIQYYKKNLKSIEKLSIMRFPNRKSILLRAFTAHKQKDYYVAITLFLTQIDGMFRDLSKKTIFSSKKVYNPLSWIEELKNKGKSDLLISVLSPLQETELLSSDFSTCTKHPNNIHRNCILHGYELDFGNELNSFKTISMINYITYVIFNIVNKNVIFDYD